MVRCVEALYGTIDCRFILQSEIDLDLLDGVRYSVFEVMIDIDSQYCYADKCVRTFKLIQSLHQYGLFVVFQV